MTSSHHSWVQGQLSAWAIWLSRRGECAVGYPRINMLAREQGRSASVDHVPVLALDAERVHRAVLGLRVGHMGQYLAVMCRYVGDPDGPYATRRPMLHREIAAKLHVTDRTVKTWVHDGELFVASALLGQAVGARRGGLLPVSFC